MFTVILLSTISIFILYVVFWLSLKYGVHFNSSKYFPDILFKLNEKYGVSWQLYSPLFSINPTHKKISGGHKQYGVFFAYNYDGKISNFNPTLIDIAPTALQMLDIDISGFEGKPIIGK